jgi:cytochrome c-type biogenesis protein CcmH
MMTWIVSTLLTSLASILIAAPFIWRYAARHSAEEPAPESAKSGSHQLKPSRAAFSVTSGLVVFSCVAIYMLSHGQETSGNTSLPRLSTLASTSQSAAPAGTPFPQASTTNQAVEQLQKFVSGESGTTSPRTSNSGLPPVDELIERLNARLQKNPKDISGWRTLGWSQFNLQHYNDAAATYAKAIELFPNIADLYSLRGEALVQAANGTVTPESKQAFGEALKIDTKDLRARFFNGLAMAQAGDKASALDILIEVANDAGANDTTLPTLRQRIADLGKELNVDANQRLKRPIDASAMNPPARPRDRDIAVTAKIPPGQLNSRDRDISGIAAIPGGDSKADDSRPPANDQTAMIKGMVENLAKRLNESPRDADGWIMLIRSKLVLNDPQGARDVFARALKIFEQGSPDHDHLVTAAKELGLNP